MTPFHRGGHQDVAAHRLSRGAEPIGEVRPDVPRALLEADEPVPGPDRVLTEPFAHRAQQDRLEPAAVEADLGEGEPGVGAAGRAQDLLPQPVGVEQLPGADPRLFEAARQPQPGELLHRVREQVDPHAAPADLLTPLVDLALDSLLVQPQSRDQAADSRSHNDDLHRPPLVSSFPGDHRQCCQVRRPGGESR
jgi:hypothetical protein